MILPRDVVMSRKLLFIALYVIYRWPSARARESRFCCSLLLSLSVSPSLPLSGSLMVITECWALSAFAAFRESIYPCTRMHKMFIYGFSVSFMHCGFLCLCNRISKAFVSSFFLFLSCVLGPPSSSGFTLKSCSFQV